VGVLETIDEHLAGLTAALSTLTPETVSGPDAAAVVERAVKVERLGASARTRFARRVTQTGAYEGRGHKHAAGWLAEQSGESVGQALGVLKTAAQLSEAPLVDDAFRGEAACRSRRPRSPPAPARSIRRHSSIWSTSRRPGR
jgi:hypothetical protein